MSDNSTLSKDLLRITTVKKQTKCLGCKSYKFQPHPWQGNLSYMKTCLKINSPACFCASSLRINQGPAWRHKEHLSIAGVTTGLGLVHRRSYAGRKSTPLNHCGSDPTHCSLFSLNFGSLFRHSQENIQPGLPSALWVLGDRVL